MVTRIREI